MGTSGQPPCRYCKDRVVGCHGVCEKYQEYNAEREKIRQQRRYDNSYYQYRRELIEKRLKRRTKGRKTGYE